MIEVLSLPPLATVQDLGRDGFWKQGLGRAGAMDRLGHSVANLLLGNDLNAATLEIPLTPASFKFTARTGFALVGAACGAALNQRALPRAFAGVAEAGDLLTLGPMRAGARVYLALAGGIDVPQILGARSTQLREAFGGFEGRVLAPGDVLRPGTDQMPDLPATGLSIEMPPLQTGDSDDIVLRALPSSQYDSFTQEARDAFWGTPYKVTPQSNRQGYRLDGATLEFASTGELRSHGIMPGIVQVPGGGQPIIQLADSATMGGYLKIAAVIEQDFWRIGQARPGDTLRFAQVDLNAAAAAVTDEAALLDSLRADTERATALEKSWR